MKLDFLIVGTQKGGTTALASFLVQHPNIFIPKEKELHFFDNDANFKNPDLDYSLYHNSFHPNKNQQIIGEATPIYMYWKPVAKRIYDYNPKIKLIFILRNPTERAYSHYIMEHNRKREFLSFKYALFFEPLRRLFSFPLQNRKFSYFDRGMYVKSINRMHLYFPFEQMLFIKNEDLLNNHQQTLTKIFSFLEIPNYNKIEPELIYSNSYDSLDKKIKNKLRKKYLKEIKRLEDLISWKLEEWKI